MLHINLLKLYCCVFVLFLQLNVKAQVVVNEINTAAYTFNNKRESDDGFEYKLNRHSLGFSFGGSFPGDDTEDFPFYFVGINYELRLYDFLGISVNCKTGERYLGDEARYIFNEKYEPIFKGSQSFNAKIKAISIGPKAYLNLFPESGIYLFGEFRSGVSFLKSTGKTISAEGEENKSGNSSKPGFYYCINLGLEVCFTDKVLVWMALGGENIDFKNAYNKIDWSEPWVIQSAPGSAPLLSVGFKFCW